MGNKLTMRNSNSILIIMLFALAGFIFAYAVLRFNYIQNVKFENKKIFGVDVKVAHPLPSKEFVIERHPSLKNEWVLFNQNPFLLVWSMLVIIMMTVASGAFPLFLYKCQELKRQFKLNQSDTKYTKLKSVLLILFVVIISPTLNFNAPVHIISDLDILFSNSSIIIPLFVVVPLFLLFPVYQLVFLIGPASDTISAPSNDKKLIEKAAFKFEQLNRVLDQATQLLAVIVIISVLLSRFMRESLKATFTISNIEILPVEINYVYGLYFSLFLAILYYPTSLYLKSRLSTFKEAILTDIEVNSESDEKWRQGVISTLAPSKSIWDTFGTALTVLSPLISSWLPEIK